MFWIYLFYSFCLAITSYFGFWVRWKWNTHLQRKKLYFESAQISVVIPFRNEANHLPTLIQSMNQLTLFPREIIWVNDHSEDNSVACLEQLSIPIRSKIIHLEPGDSGKKTALRAGISDAVGEFILTWDADIEVPKQFFVQLEATPETDLLILPVGMPARRLGQLFYELDYLYLNALNVAISGLSKPILASGANLLFNKEIFEAIDSFEQHQEIASGDDVFLLNDFKNASKRIEFSFHSNLVVQTNPPQTREAFIQQRLRWFGKTRSVGDFSATLMGLAGFIYHLGFWLVLFSNIHWKQFCILIGWKILLDFGILYPYSRIVNRKWNFLFIPFFSLFYPVYILGILSTNLFFEPNWKGRKI